MKNTTRLLFLPVSSSMGMGEYVRSVCIAKEFRRRYPAMELAFGLNRRAPYLDECPFTVFPLSDTPTRCTPEVKKIIDEFKPDIVVFDASGRAEQLAYCKQRGIKTVFVAQHKKKLNKGLRFARVKYSDLIIVAQPALLCGGLGWLQRFWLTFFNKPAPIYVGPIYAPTSKEEAVSYLQRLTLVEKNYVIVNAGGGGNMVSSSEGKVSAVDLFLRAIVDMAVASDEHFIVVAGKNYRGSLPEELPGNIKVIDHCDEREFNVLLTYACAGLLSGGSALLQALASGLTNILAVPVAKDQRERIRACVEHYGIDSCPPQLGDIQGKCRALLHKSNAKDLHERNLFCNGLENGLEQAVEAISGLIEESDKG